MKTLPVLLLTALLTPSMPHAEQFTRDIDGRSLVFEEVFYDDFMTGYDNWLPEGNIDIKVYNRKLDIDAGKGMGTIWCRKEFSGPQLVEYDVRLASDSIESNINMFLFAGKPDAAGVLASTGERDGTYSQYHEFPNYLVTILNGESAEKRDRLRIRMRLDPGFKIAGEQWYEPLIFGKVYHIGYLIEPPTVTVLIDGKTVCKTEYETALDRGLHGLRIWHTHSYYDNFRISRIVSE